MIQAADRAMHHRAVNLPLTLTLREWPIDRRVNKADAGDDDPMTIEPIESGLLRSPFFDPRWLIAPAKH